MPEVMQSLTEKSNKIEKMKVVLLIYYKPVLVFIIKLWRSRAWKNYEKLRKQQTNIVQIEKYAGKEARYLGRNWLNTV